MSELEIFKQFVDGVWEMVFGTKRRLQVKDASVKKPKRARTKGRYKADDKSTPNVNEAWVGGKAPKKRRKKDVKK